MSKISKVTNEDCLKMMAGYEDKYFDLAIVDPPYGIFNKEMMVYTFEQQTRLKDKQSKKRNTNNFFEIAEWDNIPDIKYFQELKRVSKNQIIWGANYFPDVLKIFGVSRCWICWDKKVSENFSMSMFELAYTSFNCKSSLFRESHCNHIGFAPYLKGAERAGIGIHPTQKPIKLYEWLLINYAKKNDKILDTHLGSGSSRIAAYKLGFDFYGCEIDEDYFNKQEKRFFDYKMQLQLFTNE